MKADVLALCYHRVGDDRHELSLTPSQLERQIRSLIRRGYVAIRASEFATSTAPRRLIVTFDDGHRSVLDVALAVMDRLDAVATVFVASGHAQDSDRTDASTLSWPELDALARHGWEIGSHTVTHPDLTMLSDGALSDELRDSKSRIETELRRPCTSLAYPFGVATAREAACALDAGYAVAFTAGRRYEPADVYRFPRVGVLHSDGYATFRVKTLPSTRRARRTALGGVLAGAVSYARART